MQFQPYEKYMPSNISWLTKIPEGWEIKRLKDVVSSNEKSLSNNEDPLFELKYIDISNIWTDSINENPEIFYFKDAPSRARRIPKKNDVIISTVRTYLKAVYFFSEIEENTICSTWFSVLTPKRILPIFLKFAIIGEDFIDNVIKHSKGVSYPAINDSELISLPLCLPSKETQISIVDYLNLQTNLIDKEINILIQKKEKYSELKSTLIKELVTKWLMKDTKLKDSGIEWIWQIPNHWEKNRGKDVFKYLKKINKNLECKNVLSLTYNWVINKDYDSKAGLNPDSYETYQFVQKDDLIFKLIDLENIKTSRVGIVHEYGIMSSAYIRLRSNKRVFNKFFYYLYFYYYKINLFNYLGGWVRSTINFSTLLEIPIIIPPRTEQIAISEYLDEKIGKIDEIIAKIDENIAILEEFRKTLINDAVTGKIKVV